MYSVYFKEQTFSGKDDYGRDMSLRRSVSNNKENLSEKDEFGRDIELRKAFASSISQDITPTEKKNETNHNYYLYIL